MGKSALSFTLRVEPAPSHWLTLQSPDVCDAITVPAGIYETPHAPAVQVRVWHALSEPGHCVAAVHCTHDVAPSQYVPPLWLQLALSGNGGFDGTPPEQTSFVHWKPSTGTSALSLTLTVAPEPLHWLDLQSPVDCDATGVPAAVFETPHEPSEQVRVWHSVSVPAHCVAALHCTHELAPSQ
jgi:hypothetical protein